MQQPLPPNAKFESKSEGPQDHLKTFPEYRGFTRDSWGPLRIPKEGDVIPLNDSTIVMYRIFIMREGHQVERQGEFFLVDGKPATTYRVERDYLFGMGDNRNNSEDSRYFGFIPKENVVGTPLIVYWSWDPSYHFFSELGEKLGSIRWSRIFTTIE
jgi:signal peptidase I